MASMAVFLNKGFFHLAPFEMSAIKDIFIVMAKKSQGQWESMLLGQAAGGQGTLQSTSNGTRCLYPGD